VGEARHCKKARERGERYGKKKEEREMLQAREKREERERCNADRGP
jgi:hypothetical protein